MVYDKKPRPTRGAVLVSEERKIVQAAGQIGVWTLLSRVTGLLRDILIAGLFGAGAVTDAFFVAFRIPNLLRRLVREGASNAAIIPVVTEYMVHHSRADTQDMLRALLGATSGVLLVLTGVGMVCAAPLVRVFAPGFGPQALALTVALTEMTFVYLFCIGLLALATGVLHAQRHFSAPAFAPVLLNTAIIGCALGLSRVLAEPVFSLACGVALGGVLQVAWQLPALSRLGLLSVPRWWLRHPAVRRVSSLLIPVVFGTAAYQLGLVVNTALASLLGVGSVSALWYASRLFEFPQDIGVAALASATLPSFASQTQRGDRIGLGESLGFALLVTNVVVVPTTLGLLVLAVPITASLFFWGAFQAEQLMRTAGALQTFAVGLWPNSRQPSAGCVPLRPGRYPHASLDCWAGPGGPSLLQSGVNGQPQRPRRRIRPGPFLCRPERLCCPGRLWPSRPGAGLLLGHAPQYAAAGSRRVSAAAVVGLAGLAGLESSGRGRHGRPGMAAGRPDSGA